MVSINYILFKNNEQINIDGIDQFLKLYDEGMIDFETKLYDKEIMELITVREVDIFMTLIKASEKEAKKEIPKVSYESSEKSSGNLINEKLDTFYSNTDENMEIEEEESYSENKRTKIKFVFILTIAFVLSGLYLFVGSRVLNYLSFEAYGLDKVNTLIITNLSIALMFSLIILYVFWLLSKGIYGYKRKLAIFGVSLIFMSLGLNQFSISYSTFLEEKDICSSFLEKIKRSNNLFISNKDVSIESNKGDLGRYQELFKETQKYYSKLRDDIRGIEKDLSFENLESVLSTEVFKDENNINTKISQLNALSATIQVNEGSFVKTYNDFLVSIEKIRNKEKFKNNIMSDYYKTLKTSKQWTEDYYMGKRDLLKRLNDVLIHMKNNTGNYVITMSGIKFLKEDVGDEHKKLITRLYRTENIN